MREIEFQHVWIINNISYHCLKADQNHVLYSSIFSSPNDDKLKMSFKLSSCDSDNKKAKYNLHLRINNCDREELLLKYTISILNSDGDFTPFCINSRQKISKNNGNNFYCDKFLSAEIEHTRNSSFERPGDVLTILCEICYDVVVDYADNSNPDCNKIALANLQNDCVRLLFNSEESYDVVLVFDKGKNTENCELPAHKAILGARSDVFSVMFDHDMREKSNNRVEIKDVDECETLLEHLYGKTLELFNISDELLFIADKYQLHSLKSICEGVMCFRINPESVGNLLLLADMHNATLLKSKCVEYIHCYANCVVKNRSMQKLMKFRPDICYELFKHIPQASLSSWSPPTATDYPNLSSWSYTGSRVLKCSHLWTIDKFNKNHLSVLFGRPPLFDKIENYYIESTLFPSGKSDSNSSVQFKIKLYPNGVNEDNKNHLSLYLRSKFDKNIKIAIKVQFSIVVNENSEKGDLEKEYNVKSSNYILSQGCDRGWPKFISHKELMEILKNDRLVIRCAVSCVENIDKLEIKSGLNTFAQEHEFSVARDLSKFYQSQKLTDAVFVLGTKEFKVHKSIVSVRSKVFAQMFADTNRVQIYDVEDVDAFERMLALVYGQTEGLAQWAHKMLPLLDKFEMDSLKQVCQLSLCAQLDEKNVVDYLILADKHKASLLKSKAIELIRRKHSVLIQNDALRVVQQQNLTLFNEVLCYKLANWIK